MENNLDYLSTEAKEILAKKPPWVTKWALIGILSVVTALVISGFTFSYSEIVAGDFLLTTEESPILVLAPKTGYLYDLKIKEGYRAKMGDTLAVFKSEAEFNDVQALEKQLEGLEAATLETLQNFQPLRNLQLGKLAEDYDDFLSIFQYIPIEGVSPADQNTIFMLRQKISQLRQSINAVEFDIAAKKRELEALEKEFTNTNELYKSTRDEPLSNKIFEINSKKKEKENDIAERETKIQDLLDQIQEINVRISQVEGQSSLGLDNKLFQLNKSINALRGKIRDWKLAHIVTAPIDGKLSFFQNVVPNQIFTKDTIMFAITPESTEGKYVGHASIPVEGSGRVKADQKVKIKFHRYPHQEFGVVMGRVKKMFALPKGNAYSVQVELTNGLETSTGAPIDFHQQMAGTAEIETDKKLFVKKLFEQMF